jgi:hypothetical protein
VCQEQAFRPDDANFFRIHFHALGQGAEHADQARRTQMRFGFIAALVIAILGIVSVFIAIPIVSDYSFWVVVVAYIILAGSGKW